MRECCGISKQWPRRKITHERDRPLGRRRRPWRRVPADGATLTAAVRHDVDGHDALGAGGAADGADAPRAAPRSRRDQGRDRGRVLDAGIRAARPGAGHLLRPNINGGPTTKDNNGFISRVRPDGAVENLKFIEGGHGGATLNAPKGLALRGDTLWVADIDMVGSFDANTGPPRDSVSLAGMGAVSLKDMATAQTGALYI